MCRIQFDADGTIYFIAADARGSNPGVLNSALPAPENAASLLNIASGDWTYPDHYFSLAVY
jgi:hypothetical protein